MGTSHTDVFCRYKRTSSLLRLLYFGYVGVSKLAFDNYSRFLFYDEVGMSWRMDNGFVCVKRC